MEYGLIGKTLGHSFSKPIHEALGGYPYELKELPDEAAVRAFFTARRFPRGERHHPLQSAGACPVR